MTEKLLIQPLEDVSQLRPEVKDFEGELQTLILPSNALPGIKLTDKLGSGCSSTVYGGITTDGNKIAIKISFDSGEVKTYKAFSDIGVTPKFHFATEIKGEWQVDPDRPSPAGPMGPSDTPPPINITLIVTDRMDMTLKQGLDKGIAKEYIDQIADQLLLIYKQIEDVKYVYGDWNFNNIMLKFDADKKSVEVKLVDFEDAVTDMDVPPKDAIDMYVSFNKWIDELRRGEISTEYLRC